MKHNKISSESKKIKSQSSSKGMSVQNKKIDTETIKQTFSDCYDVKTTIKNFSLQKGLVKVTLVYCEGLYDSDKLNADVLPRLQAHLLNTEKKIDPTSFIENFSLTNVEEVQSIQEIIEPVFNGDLLVHFHKDAFSILIGLSKHPKRNPEEPNTEVSITGPRDGFIEELNVNVALIRKRLKTKSLKYENYSIGSRASSQIALLYVDDIINPETLDTIKSRLKELPGQDALYSMSHLQQLLSPTKYAFVPTYNYTGRPDFAVESLLQGRFVLLVDGEPTALIAPVTLSFLIKSPEDLENMPPYISFARFLRLFGLVISISLPAFWIALVTFHQDQIPLTLLSTLSSSRKGIPFPTPIEALIMLSLFELFREAGLRLPMAIGQTLTVVGGLIIGDAAIAAGLTDPAMVVVIATSVVSTFTLVNQSVIGIMTLLRFFLLIGASFLGLFGLFCFWAFILIYLSTVKSFGVPYTSPISPFIKGEFFQAILYVSWKQKKKRPGTLGNMDTSRKE